MRGPQRSRQSIPIKEDAACADPPLDGRLDGQVGSAADNAAMESFFSLLQRNVLDRRRWATRDELRIAIITWIERTYHRRRRQATLGRLTPIEHETIMTHTAASAA
jgi:putative transposase